MKNGLTVYRLQVGILGTNCYLVIDENSREGYVVDPGADGRRIVKNIGSLGMKTKGVLLTHGHWDHVGAAAKVAKEVGTVAYIHRKDGAILGEKHGGDSAGIAGLITHKPGEIEFIDEEIRFPLGKNELRVLHTPGHTPGSVSFSGDGILMCGDLIFSGSVGRTDLRGSSTEDLLASIKNKVWDLPDETRILPGHGSETKLGLEKRENPFLVRLKG